MFTGRKIGHPEQQFQDAYYGQKEVRFESPNVGNIYCRNNESSTYAESRDTNNEQHEEIVTANLFEET